jgi:hypothetical protein
MVGGHAHEITLATTWNRPRWNVQCHGTLKSQHEGLSNDLVMYARVSPGKPDIEVWEQANAGTKKLAIVLKITGTRCKCRRKAVEASGPNLRSCHVARVLMYSILIENGITVCIVLLHGITVLLHWPLTFDPLLHLWMLMFSSRTR